MIAGKRSEEEVLRYVSCRVVLFSFGYYLDIAPRREFLDTFDGTATDAKDGKVIDILCS